MSAAFKTPDIEALVANFSPLSVSNGRPGLVRTRSGNHLVGFSHLAARFKNILETCQQRIHKSQIPTILDIEGGAEKWLYEEIGIPLRENQGGDELIPVPVANIIVTNLIAKARNSIVDVHQHAYNVDMSINDLQELIDGNCDYLLQVSSRGKFFLFSNQVAEDLKDRLRDAIRSAGSEICDLPAATSEETPHAVLNHFAREIAAEMGGEIRIEGDHAVFVPASYSDAVNEKLKQIRSNVVKELVQNMDDRGYCVVDDEGLLTASHEDESIENVVLREWGSQFPAEAEPRMITCTDQPSRPENEPPRVAFILPDALQRGLDDLKRSVSLHAEQLFKSGDRPKLKFFVQSLNKGDWSVLDVDELSSIIASTQFAKEVLKSLSENVEKLEREENDHFVQLVEARLSIPLQLYASGLDTIRDTTLKQHLEDFVTDHFRREAVPQMIKAAGEQALLYDKERNRQMEKLKQAMFEAKSFATLQTAIVKFNKKLKIDLPAGGLIRRVKYRTLETSAKSLRQMTRGSDVLQNLIWILLAQKSDGLFMSSGKDTSRMIKQYDAVGDPELAKKLIEWRDKLKSGQDDKNDINTMKEAAKTAVAQFASERRKSSNSSSSTGTRRRLSSLTVDFVDQVERVDSPSLKESQGGSSG